MRLRLKRHRQAVGALREAAEEAVSRNPGARRVSYTPTVEVWELVFMMVVLKIPIAYLCAVVYWAVKAEPKPPEPARSEVFEPPEPHSPWASRFRPRGPRTGPRRGPQRRPARARRATVPR